jgi:hypothetical protein
MGGGYQSRDPRLVESDDQRACDHHEQDIYRRQCGKLLATHQPGTKAGNDYRELTARDKYEASSYPAPLAAPGPSRCPVSSCELGECGYHAEGDSHEKDTGNCPRVGRQPEEQKEDRGEEIP